MSGAGKILMEETALGDGATDGEWITMPYLPGRAREELLVQIEITDGDADVMVQGRVSDEAAAVDLLDAVQDQTLPAEIHVLAWVPQLRVAVTNALSAPTIRVEVFHGT